MPNQKTNTPNSILDVKQYIFCDSNGRLVLSDPRFVKIFKSCQKALKSFDLSFKKDVPYFKMSLARCPHCGTRHVVKYGFITSWKRYVNLLRYVLRFGSNYRYYVV